MLYSLIKIEDDKVVFLLNDKEIKTDKENVIPKIKETYLYELINGKFILNEEESLKIKNSNKDLLKKLIKNK